MPKPRLFLPSLALFSLNAFLSWPLFWIEYLDDLHSNEGSFIIFGKFLRDYWPHCLWFPWFNAGMPFENTYLPLVSFLVAAGSLIAHCSPAHAFHFLAALAYSLAPVFLFLLAHKESQRLTPSLLAAVLWSLFSPSMLFPKILEDLGTVFGLRRLQNIVFWGETPHNVALCLLPVALLLLSRFLDKSTPRRFALSVLAAAAVMITNAFGMVVISICALFLLLARKEHAWRTWLSVGTMLAAAYLLICRLFPPSLIHLVETNSQLVGGDYRLTSQTSILAGAFLLAMAALWAITLRLPTTMLRFAVLVSACFGGIVALAYQNLSFIPQPHRYHLEWEVGLCLFVAFVLDPLLLRLRPNSGLKTATWPPLPHGRGSVSAFKRVDAFLSRARQQAVFGLFQHPARAAVASAVIVLLSLSWVASKDYRYARSLIRPVAITQSIPYQQARWIDTHLPGQRVLIASEAAWWFNLFANNPQLGAGHEPSAPNWMQRAVVYFIYSGQNAGNQDGPLSVFWLKAYGCGAIVVTGPASYDHYHATRNPKKFDGLLPLVWRSGDDYIYQVPLRSTSLAHVIPASAIVARRPIHGLDISPVRPYVAALDDPTLPLAKLAWQNPDQARISASLSPGQVISVQVTYDPGWRATVSGKPVPVHSDQLGMIVIEANCSGPCEIDLEFTGGPERTACLVISLLTAIALAAMLLWPAKVTSVTAI
jgi:hypothetical protein